MICSPTPHFGPASAEQDRALRITPDEGADETAGAMPLDVAITIVSYRSAGDILACFAALERSICPDFRVVVCENGGEAAFVSLRDRLPERLAGGQPVELLLAPENLGFAGGVNFCIDHSRPADAYWILNPDTQPEPTALAAMLARLQRSDCGAVGHDLVLSDGRLQSLGGHWRAWSARAISLGHGKPRRMTRAPEALEARINYILGASMLVSRGFLERAGKMREDYFLYCEEVEWCLRAARRGEKLGYAPEAVVQHAQGTTTGGGNALRTRSRVAVYLNERNRMLLTRDLFPRRLPIAAPIALLHILVRYGKARAWRQAGYAAHGWLAGLRDERGKPPWLERSEEAAHRISLHSDQCGRQGLP